MTFRTPAGRRLPRLPRRPRLLLPVIAAIVLLIVALALYVSIYTNVLWYRSVGYTEVYLTRLRTEIVLFVIFGIAMAAALAANLVIAYRLRPAFHPLSPEQQTLERYRVVLEPHLRQILFVVVGLVALIAGLGAASHWRTWQMWRNGQHFGQKDLQFHRDVSYFAFTYPFQRFILGFLFTVVVLCLIGVAVTHYVFGGVRLQSPGEKVVPAARAHLSVLLGIFVLLKAAAYWLDRYGLAFSPRGIVTGPSYTDVHAVLPAKTILLVVAVICSGLFFANVVRRGWLLPTVGFGLMVLSAIIIGGVYPFIIQQFQVKPSAVDKESKYIARNITATRQAFGLTNVNYVPYPGTSTASASTLLADNGTLPNIRLLDPNYLNPTFQQLQGFKGFYTFPDVLDIDRYHLNGREQEEVVAVREVDTSRLNSSQQNWINEHLVYTHGFGFVAAPSNTVSPGGAPSFNESDFPGPGQLGVTQPRVYFGESSPSYSVVGAPGGTPPRELDYPSSSATGQQNTTYTGKGGVAIGSTWRRLLYAVKFKEKNLLLSSGVNADSRILYIRDPRARVHMVAPYLTLDGDPYPAVVGGRIVWIVDGYTTSDGYPYSERVNLADITSDVLTQRGALASEPSAEINYIRNSVKAVVDAYDGSVTLYAWNPNDPVLKTWEHIFPHTVVSNIPPELEAHFRYPEDLFKVQRDLLQRYHVSNPRSFFNGTDFWNVPAEPTRLQGDQPPYYLTLTPPGSSTPTFALTTPLLANNKRTLASFVLAPSDPGPDYGKLTVLTVTSDEVDGPGQIFNSFSSFPAASTQLSLLNQHGSTVDYANLLTLPVDGGFLYVEPIYVKSTGTTSFPTLQKVLASWTGTVAYENDLNAALRVAFGASASTTPQQPTTPTSPTAPLTVSAAIRQAISDAQRAYATGQAALRRGDFAAYGTAQQQLAAALNRLQQLTATAHGKASPSGSARPSPAASRSP